MLLALTFPKRLSHLSIIGVTLCFPNLRKMWPPDKEQEPFVSDFNAVEICHFLLMVLFSTLFSLHGDVKRTLSGVSASHHSFVNSSTV